MFVFNATIVLNSSGQSSARHFSSKTKLKCPIHTKFSAYFAYFQHICNADCCLSRMNFNGLSSAIFEGTFVNFCVKLKLLNSNQQF